MSNNNNNTDANLDDTLDWEYMSDFYEDSNQERKVRSFEEIAKESEIDSTQLLQDTASQSDENELLLKTVNDVKNVRELSHSGKTVAQIASILSLTNDYVLTILMTLEGYSEDSDIAVAHLILL